MAARAGAKRWREIQPMDIRYKKQEAVPVLVRRQRAALDHASDIVASTKLLLHKDMSKYVVRSIMRELYARLKGSVQPDEKVRSRVDPYDTVGVVRALRQLGSLYVYRVGTCLWREEGDENRLKVVLDLGLVKTVLGELEDWYQGDQIDRLVVKPTGYGMWLVPRMAFEIRAFEDVGSGVLDFNRLKMVTGLLDRGLSRRDAEKAGDSTKFKVAVEVERSEMNLGSLVFFMEVEEAAKVELVKAELAKATEMDTQQWSLVRVLDDEQVYCYRLQKNPATSSASSSLASSSLLPSFSSTMHREQVLPMEIVYDRNKEVPVLSVMTSNADHISNLYIPNPRYLLFTDLNRYMVKNILRELYAYSRNKAFRRATKFDLGDYDYVVKTLEMFGSLYVYKLGTCVKRDGGGRAEAVVVDKGVWKTIESNVVDCFSDKFDQFSMKWAKPTGYVMWSIPKLVVENDAFRIRHGVVDLCHPKLRRELLEQGMDLRRANSLIENVRFKAAVEVERSLLGKGNVVFFMDPKLGKDPVQVLQKLGKTTRLDTAGLTVVPHPEYDNPEYMFSFRLQLNRTSSSG